ncbi:MAG: hypothetical protein CMJ25_31620, partial [Phycisphaerae bacterium]|nr:hypothetical protein [Phycisphaerae bacterium]
FVDVEGINTVSAFSASVDPSGGIGQYQSISITLSIDKRGGLSDAGVVFGRCGARSVSTKALITSNVDREQQNINVNTDLTSLSYPRLMHIGAETVRINQASSSILLAPSGRGAANTAIQGHSIDLEGVSVPEITTEITTFRGRRAKLYMAHKYSDGSVSAWTTVVNGFIESTPTIEEGDSISLSLVPLVALIDQVVVDKGLNQTHLLQNYHFYDSVNGSALEYAMTLNDLTFDFVKYDIDTTATNTANTLHLIRNSNSLVEDWDESLPTGLDSSGEPYTSDSHPRFPRGSIRSITGRKPIYPTAITETTNAGIDILRLTLNSTPAGSATTGIISRATEVRFPLRTEIKANKLAGLYQWPNVINDTLETSGPLSSQGDDGGVLSWRLTEDNKIIVRKLSDSDRSMSLYLYDSKETLNVYLGDRVNLANRWGGDNPREILRQHKRIWYPIDFSFPDLALDRSADFRQFDITSDQPNSSNEIRDIAMGYYQRRESRILVEDPLGLPSVSGQDNVPLTISFYDRASESMRDQVLWATHQTVATFNGSNVGYYIHLNLNYLDNSKSFADWSDGERAIISNGGRFDSIRPGTAILQLLMSGGGDLINGFYDVFSTGCNIASSEIDIDSFLAVDASSPFTVSGQFLGIGADVREMINNLLQLLGACIVMKRDESGNSRISLVSMGAERAADTSVTISADDWLADPPPHWDSYEDIVTQIKYEYDYDAIEEKYRSEVFFNNHEAINRYGGERSKINISLPGVSSDQFGRGAGDVFAEFLPTSQRIFNLLSNPLRVWRGSIGTGKSAYLDLGSYVQCSSPHLRGYGDDYGVTDGIGMVRSIHQELMSEGCDLELLTTGLSPVAWNSTATVATIPSTTTVTVNQDDYSESGVDDVSFFRAGAVVDYLPIGNHDNGTLGLVILSISGDTITFTAAHGLTVTSGTLEPTTYANASDEHRLDAYLANSSDVINLNIGAQEYS